MEQLDKLDRRILFELDCHSRQTMSELSRKLRQGRDRVEYRVERLVEKGILRKFTTSVNLASMGFRLFKTYLRLENNKLRVQEFTQYLKNHPRVYWIALSDGGWDLLFAIFARDEKEYYDIHQSILSAFNDIVLNFGMYTLVQLLVHRKHYFVGKGKEYSIVGGTPGNAIIDPTDYAILKQLSADSRASVTDLADKLDSTPSIVKYRIEKMEREKVITGYRIEVDLRKLDMQFFKTQLFLRSYDTQLQKKFCDYCTNNPHITYYIQQLGDCTIELEMEVMDYQQYNAIIEDIRTEFSRLVRNFQTVMIRKAFFNWVPQDLHIPMGKKG